MLSALLYLQYHSTRNRLLMRLRRLKRPKYLLGGIVGLVYFYFYFFRYTFGLMARHASLVSAASPAVLLLSEALGDSAADPRCSGCRGALGQASLAAV